MVSLVLLRNVGKKKRKKNFDKLIDADCIAVSLFNFINRLYVVILLGLGFWKSLFHYFIRFRVIGGIYIIFY